MNTETEKMRIMLDMLSGNGEGAIERSEARGQQEVVKNGCLPKFEQPDWQHIDAKPKYEAMGIKILGEYDDLFYNAELPQCVEIKATEHPMWNEVYKDGAKVASFFYKASVYDRGAFIRFEM